MGNKPKPIQVEKVKEIGFHINPWAIVSVVLMIGIVAFATIKGAGVYNQWKANWDVVTFANDNPELVRTIKTEYDTNIAELKLELTSPKD